MPRLPRIDAPGVIHHVIIRGIEKRAIFQDQSDYEDFLKRLEDLIPQTQTRCYAWVLMNNHAHFLFRKGQRRKIVEARGLFCHWCRQELGLSVTALARMLSLTPSAVVYTARRGEQIAVDHGFLSEPRLNILKDVPKKP